MEMERVVPGQGGGLMIFWETEKVRKKTSMHVLKFRACGCQRRGLVEFTDASDVPGFGAMDVPFHFRPNQPQLQPRPSQRGSWMGDYSSKTEAVVSIDEREIFPGIKGNKQQTLDSCGRKHSSLSVTKMLHWKIWITDRNSEFPVINK